MANNITERLIILSEKILEAQAGLYPAETTNEITPICQVGQEQGKLGHAAHY